MKTETIPAKDGHKAIKFKKGALHAMLGVPQGDKIPTSKMDGALDGKDGALAKKRALFAKNILRGGK